MTQNDMKIVNLAEKLSYDQIDEQELMMKCETEDGRKAVHDIYTSKWHREEFRADME